MLQQTIQKLNSESPEFRELLQYLAEEAQKLNSLEGLGLVNISERGLEVTARLRAYETLREILKNLVDIDNSVKHEIDDEYVV